MQEAGNFAELANEEFEETSRRDRENHKGNEEPRLHIHRREQQGHLAEYVMTGNPTYGTHANWETSSDEKLEGLDSLLPGRGEVSPIRPPGA